ncbi:MAG: hypothetical protein HY426_02905, partial [Candidatus Levybacteria bacterium]|nr:hypothetical protein [Candidatus Levybacteria bacterium]
PYYPSKINAAFPAGDKESKLNLVTLRWASRDPLNGYKSPDERESTRFSTQDYFTIGLDHDYFENLLRLYTSREFGQITIGLEGDFPAEVYSGNFNTQLSIAKKLVSEGGVEFSTMKSFASAYMNKYKSLSPGLLIESSDILGGSERIYWFQNPKYRAGIIYDFKNNQSQIIDLRSYYQDFIEPFYLSPNKQYDLFVVVPSIIDSKIKPDLRITLDTGSLISSDERSISFEKGKIVFEDEGIKFFGINFKPDRRITDSGLVRISSDSIYPSSEYIYSSDGLEFSEIKPKIPFALKSRTPQILIYILVALFVLALAALLIVLKKKNRKYANLFLFGLVLGFLLYAGFKMNRHLYVSQSEIDALLVLKNLDNGKVLLYDKDCLRCRWTSKNKPAAMEGRKDYVEKLSKKEVVYSLDFVLAKNPDEAKNVLRKTGARYIYLAKYEDYIEALSFNPADLGVKRSYENANAVIYEVN